MASINKITVGGTPYNITLPSGLTEEEQAQIRQNIGAVSSQDVEVVRDGTYPDMTVGNATNAVNAENVVAAETAQNAENAANAVNAENDGTGNNIQETYLSKTEWLNLEHPIGSHHIQFDGEETPAARFGFTWEIDTDYEGRVLVGSGAGYELGATGGEATHTLTIPEMPKHSHVMPLAALAINQDGDIPQRGYSENLTLTKTTEETGGGQPHNIMQPYKVVGVWKRTT